MPASLSDYAEKELKCESLLECIHGLKALDKEVFLELEKEGSKTVDELADTVDRDRSTTHRSIQRLLEAGMLEKEQRNYDQGGYYYIYNIKDPDEIAETMQRKLNDSYAQISNMIQEFRDKYR